MELTALEAVGYLVLLIVVAWAWSGFVDSLGKDDPFDDPPAY